MANPRLYATFLLWMLSELFENSPKSAIPTSRSSCSFSTRRICCSTMRPKPLLDKIEQVVRLIRSKGVGVYFVTQNPIDVPDTVLAPTRQPRAARVARLYAARPEGGEGGGGDVPAQSKVSTPLR